MNSIDQSILISNLNPSQLSIARSNALTHINNQLILELDESDLQSRSSPRKLRSHKHLDQLKSLIGTCSSSQMFLNPPIQLKIKCMVKIMNSGQQLVCDETDVNELSHLFHVSTMNAKPNLPDAFTMILKSILTIHKST